MAYMIGCDTGGTFTDVVVMDERGEATAGKALSTPPTFTEGIMNALTATAESLGVNLDALLEKASLFVLGTTIATNTLLTRSGKKVGLMTTIGHEHVHHIARGGMSKWTGLPEREVREAYRTEKVSPLLPKSLVRGITERIDWKGSVVCPLDVEDAKRAVKSLVDEGVDSVAVCLLWSFGNPAHETEVKKILKMYPKIYTAISNELAPTLGEYARSNTTIIDAYVGPVVGKFLASLSDLLNRRGLKHPLLVMQAHGGCAYASDIKPYATFESGPAAGVIAARYVSESIGRKNVIATDVGGTSFDISLIYNGLLTYAREPVIGRFPVSFPMIDIASIGAGGGSIAWIDPFSRLLRVGPMSAGASPGPACYGFGGSEATVTDADLVLGYLNPDYFLGGKMKLYPDKAYEAIKRLADHFGWDVTATASGIYDIVNAHMADLVRVMTIERGYDPTEFILLSYGGNGPMHSAVFGAEVGVSEVIVPPNAATFSALGSATSDILHSHRIFQFNPMPMDPNRLNGNFEAMERTASEELERDGIEKKNQSFNYAIDMRWGAQYYTVRMPIERKKYDAKGVQALCDQFDELYESLYGKGSAYTAAGRFANAFILEAVGKIPRPSLVKHKIQRADPSPALKGKRDVFFKKYNEYRPTNTYDYSRLAAGNIIPGPAIIEASKTTIVIPPERTGRVDEYFNIIIK